MNSSHATVVVPVLTKLPPRLQSKRSIVPAKVEKKLNTSCVPNREDLEDIVNNLSSIVKKSELSLTPKESSTNLRRTSSLHISNGEDLSKSFFKSSNSHHETLTNSTLDLSRLNTQRRSLRNVEKFSGIKCSLPTGSSTLPNTCKVFDKHTTPNKNRQMNSSSSSINNPITPTETKGKTKSPWRLRFEKFVNHQELTPITPTDESLAFKTAKTSSLNKENRTPSFRLPSRRTSKIHSVQKKID